MVKNRPRGTTKSQLLKRGRTKIGAKLKTKPQRKPKVHEVPEWLKK
jgi:hypothetical protein